MRLIKKERKPDGRRNIYILGKRIISYKTKKKTSVAYLYEQRFNENFSTEDKLTILETFLGDHVGYKPNILHPRTFNEKIQWCKLFDKNPLRTICSDKYLVRDYVAEKIGEKYLVPLLGVYDSPEEIDFDKLPNQFAMKINWGSGQNIIVKDKKQLDIAAAKKQLSEWMKPHSNLYYKFLEYDYKNIVPKIVIEKYLETVDKSALDYKFLCFGGKPYFCWVSNKYKEVQERSFYDMDWNMLDLELVEEHKVKAKEPLPKPDNFDEMVKLAEKLCQDFAHVRVDLYNLPGGEIKFGELTLNSASGFSPWSPESFDFKMGELFDISKIKKVI